MKNFISYQDSSTATPLSLRSQNLKYQPTRFWRWTRGMANTRVTEFQAIMLNSSFTFIRLQFVFYGVFKLWMLITCILCCKKSESSVHTTQGELALVRTGEHKMRNSSELGRSEWRGACSSTEWSKKTLSPCLHDLDLILIWLKFT